ncbi:hypothetical protein BF95_04720 [Sphingobium sp. Ant17]|nr:hypothetical protein BF95_04720 [Sphingobium sp. Ant17]
MARLRPAPRSQNRTRFAASRSPDIPAPRRLRFRSHLCEHLAKAMQLIHEVEHDVDAFVVHAEVSLQIMYEARAGRVHVGQDDGRGSALAKEPFAIDPLLERVEFDPRVG